MKVGKVPEEKLRELILPRLGSNRKDVLVGAGIGEDAAIIDFGPEVCVVSTDPITGSGTDIGKLAVYVACNDVAASGATPIGVQAALLLPEQAGDNELKGLMAEIHEACQNLGIAVLGGHTEVVSKVQEPIIVMTALGRAPKDRYVSSHGARVGDDIVVTKAVGLEGTAILASDYAELLAGKVADAAIEKAQEFIAEISVVKEALIAAEVGVSAMHDITEGGFYGALHELGEAAGVGFEVDASKLPVRPETRAICQVLGLDPLGLISSGSLLITTAAGQELVERLRENHISAAVIGRITPSKRQICRGAKWEPFPGPQEDELWRFMAELGSDSGL